MPKQTPELTQIILVKMKDDGIEPDYIAPLNGPFDVTNVLQALVVEASAKGKGIVVTVQVANLQQFFEVPAEGDQSNVNPEQQ